MILSMTHSWLGVMELLTSQMSFSLLPTVVVPVTYVLGLGFKAQVFFNFTQGFLTASVPSAEGLIAAFGKALAFGKAATLAAGFFLATALPWT